jgi:hypothetical protein
MPQPADFGRLYYGTASNKLAYCDMTTVAPTTAVPTLANGLDAESLQNPPDLENLFLHRWMLYYMDRSFETGDFLAEKRARGL